jgi:preprotein translocase subunit YajC
MGIIFLLALPVLMYFLLIRPQQKRMREQKDLLSAVQEGDEIMTTGGIYGYVNAVEDDTIWLEIAEGIEVRLAKGAVMKRIPPTETPTDDATPDTASGTAALGTSSSSNGKAPEHVEEPPAEESPQAGPEAER